tara:strand:+ start:10048 stop:10404 length:357 start_codon:yes stop_codon:yes gene_type:complete
MEGVRNSSIANNESCEGLVEISVRKETEMPICSFSGKPADYYIGLAGPGYQDQVRLIGAIGIKFVETAIMNILGQGVDEVQWPVILDLNKRILYHSYAAHLKGLSPVMGWKRFTDPTI